MGRVGSYLNAARRRIAAVLGQALGVGNALITEDNAALICEDGIPMLTEN